MFADKFVSPSRSEVDRLHLLMPSLIASILLAACATGSLGNNVGTLVEGEGANIDFSWVPDHPWSNSFRQPGRLHLYAQYRRNGEPVEEDLGAGRSTAQRQLRFELPKGLRGLPDGGVCFFLGAGGNGGTVPVRTASKTGGDTVRFGYPSWSAYVRESGARYVDQREADERARTLTAAEQRAAAETASLAKIGVQRREDCTRLAAATAAGGSVPKNVLAPREQALVAQKICVRQARNMRNPEMTQASDQVDAYDVIKRYPFDALSPESARRQTEARQFLAHWQRWFDQTGVNYVPEVGSASDHLPVVHSVMPIIKNWNVERQANPATPAPGAIVFGLLDAHKGCLDDVTKQLAFKYDAWQKARANQPVRDRLYAERQLAECTGRVDDLTTLQSRIGDLRRQMAADRARLSESPEPAPFASSGRTVLNGHTCSL